MPWLFYARSADPFYLTMGRANIRLLTDVQVIHHDAPEYPHREFHFGQGRLVGSTRHTNGFNTWGGDHAVLAHLTCYNAMILAHYLTGDLRLREVVVDEWQRTVLTDRRNPNFAPADRSRRGEREGARDNSCPLGELIDLYQMTYEPALLGHIAPMLEIFLNQQMRHWGMPLHNVLMFHRSEQARMHLLAAVAEYRQSLGKPAADPRGIWYTHSPHENFALASIVDPDSNAHVDAYLASDPAVWRDRSRRILAREPRAIAFCGVPDHLLYLPRVMFAVAQAGGDLAGAALTQGQPVPADQTGWTRCVIREPVDQAIMLRLVGSVGDGGVPLRVLAPDGAPLLSMTVPAGRHFPFQLTIPADGRTGEYVVLLGLRDVKDQLQVPLSDLPEVYPVLRWSQHAPTRFFVRARGAAPEPIAVQPHKSRGVIATPVDDRLLASTESGDMLQAETGPDGVWVDLRCRYAHAPAVLVLAVSPDRWFSPSPAALAVAPAPDPH
jgi:hypothetical protein